MGEDSLATGINFSKYVDLMFESRGTLYWQTAVCPGSAGGAQAAGNRSVGFFPKRTWDGSHPPVEECAGGRRRYRGGVFLFLTGSD